MAAAVAAAMVPQGVTSEWVPTPFYVAAAAAKHFSPIAAPLPHRVNGPLRLTFESDARSVTVIKCQYIRDKLANWQLKPEPF